MKILFTADIHIKLGQKNVPVDWARARYKMLFEQLNGLEKLADLLVLGGDIWDKTPTMDELEIFFDYVHSIKIPAIIFSGNHESVKKNTTFFSNFKNLVKNLNPQVTVIDDFYTLDNVDFIPYNKLKEYNPADINFHGDILCTHVRGEIPPHVKPEVPLELFERWKVVLAGDLHSYENSQRNILYPGSPVTTSFHRNNVDTGVILLDSDTFTHKWIKLDLPQLIRKTIKVGDAMFPTPYDHTIYEIEGDISELGSLQDNELIDKKIVKRDFDTVLILTPDLSLKEEVNEYLKYVLQLNDAAIEQALQELNNYADKL